MRLHAGRINDHRDLRRRADGAHMESGLQKISNRVSRTRRAGRLAIDSQMVCQSRPAHQSAAPQQRQMLRYRRITRPKEFRQLTDRTLILDQPAPNPQALNGENQ